MAVTCPYGSEIKPGVQPYVYGYEVATQIAEQLSDYPLIGNIVDSLDWVVYDLQWVSDHGPFDFPTFTMFDFLDLVSLAGKVKDYFNAYLWAAFCQCAARPGGCGSGFDPESPGFDELAAGEAAQAGEGVGGTATPTFVVADKYAGGGDHTSWGMLAGAAIGDTVVFVVFLLGSPTPTPQSGWTIVYDHTGYGKRVVVWTHQIESLSEVYEWHWSSGVDYDAALLFYRGCNPSTPISDLAYVFSYTDTGLTIASEAGSALQKRLMAYAAMSPNTALFTVPAGHTTRINTQTGRAQCWSDLVLTDGVDIPSAQATQAVGGIIGVAVRMILSPSQAMGYFWRWTVDDAGVRAWGYRLDPNNPNSAYRFGSVGPGYIVEVRYPTSQGGSESGAYYSVNIKQADGTPVDYYRWEAGGVPVVTVYPCQYSLPAVPMPLPPVDLPTGECQVTGTLDSIASFLCKLDSRIGILDQRQQNIEGYILNINSMVGDLYGPYEGNFGQMDEPVSGHLGVLVQDALNAMSNYEVTGGTKDLVEGGISGDWVVDDGGNHFIIELESIPAQAGHRVSSPPLYEVTRRAEQLGWAAWDFGGSMQHYQPLTWGSNYVRFPGGVASAFHVHLMPGATADVYRSVDTRTARLAE